jgi:amidohydrolase
MLVRSHPEAAYRRTFTVALLVAAVLVTVAPAAAEDGLPANLEAALEAATPTAIAHRHRIHANPELSNRETETAALVAAHLRELGLEVETGIAHTGVIATLRGALPGPTVAVRADMDALPVVEATDLPYASTKRTEFLGQEVGVAHACGHDVHVSVGLGLASALAAVRAELLGTVVFVFQPAEEGPPPGERGGAELMLAEGALADPRPEAIFALHAFPDMRVGEVGWVSGPTYAAVDQFRIELHGTQSHGARPEDSVDPIVLGAQVVQALQTIPSRSLPPLEPSVVTVGIFRGGERFNIIPADVHLEGTVRTYSDAARATVERRMRQILDGLTAAAGATYDLDYAGNAPATVNDPALSQRVRPWLDAALGPANVLDGDRLLVGEDFAYFARQIPGFYLRLGVEAEGHPSGGLHTPTFRADDSAVPVGMRAMAALVWNYLAGGADGEGSAGSPR